MVGVKLCCRQVGCWSCWGVGWWAGSRASQGPCPQVGDAAAEVKNPVNHPGALSVASGVYLVRPPVPAPMCSGSSSALPPGGLVTD